MAKLRLQKGNNKVVRINLARLRSGASQWDLTDQGVDDELMTVLAMPIAVNASVTELNLGYNEIGDTGAAAIAKALAVNATMTDLRCTRFLTKPS